MSQAGALLSYVYGWGRSTRSLHVHASSELMLAGSHVTCLLAGSRHLMYVTESSENDGELDKVVEVDSGLSGSGSLRILGCKDGPC